MLIIMFTLFCKHYLLYKSTSKIFVICYSFWMIWLAYFTFDFLKVIQNLWTFLWHIPMKSFIKHQSNPFLSKCYILHLRILFMYLYIIVVFSIKNVGDRVLWFRFWPNSNPYIILCIFYFKICHFCILPATMIYKFITCFKYTCTYYRCMHLVSDLLKTFS